MHFHAPRRRAAGATLSLLCAGLLLAARGTRQAASAPKPLRAGGSTFWDGPTIASGNVLDPSLCDRQRSLPDLSA